MPARPACEAPHPEDAELTCALPAGHPSRHWLLIRPGGRYPESVSLYWDWLRPHRSPPAERPAVNQP